MNMIKCKVLTSISNIWDVFQKCNFQFDSAILNKIKSFFTCTKINGKESRDQNSNQCKMPNIFVFSI